MLSKEQQEKIAKEIAGLEIIIERNEGKNPELAKAAKNKIMSIPERYKIDLVDLFEIDEIVQRILKKLH